MRAAQVGWRSRAIDALSLLLLVSGALLFYRAYLGMHALRARAAESKFTPGSTEAFEFLNEFGRLRLTSWIAMALAALGVAIGVYAALHARRAKRALVS